jgi:hypothetical protein
VSVDAQAIIASITARKYGTMRAHVSRRESLLDSWPGDSSIPVIRPERLDFACLNAISGCSFWPGMEGGREADIWRNPRADFGACQSHVDTRFFRIQGESSPGDLTKDCAVPWQIDYQACGETWWPSSRPSHVLRGDGTRGQRLSDLELEGTR